ncbi:hypothetical protein DGMP_07520 [Desulfomarina profundi]|uniref:Uncharacterized protein n=1 Tax=Desulfomarina profundi TaxID=2772557 RepID=A0A8D5FKU8_9BACT|nr:hypothetical protein DGMP_07520 [Desulfomarina profundi]
MDVDDVGLNIVNFERKKFSAFLRITDVKYNFYLANKPYHTIIIDLA